MKILLFLGSGVSLETGLPDVWKVTDSVLNGAWHAHSDSNFYPEYQAPAYQPEKWITRHQDFLRLLKRYADTYFEKRRRGQTNYEDLFYLAHQVEDEVRGEIDNPLLAPFLEHFRIETEALCRPLGPIETEYDLANLANQSCDFIQCAVWHLLKTEGEPKGFGLLPALANSPHVQRLDICTLNHDLLIEKVLGIAGIRYTDGFSKPDGDIRWFTASYGATSTKVTLCKLHGSTNLWRLEQTRGDRSTFKYGLVPTGRWPHDCKDCNGKRIAEVDARPTFLTGSYNKMLDYRYGIFAYIHNHFFRVLREHNLIVMSGYGWNDRGINGWLSEWFWASPKNRLVLLHRHPEEIRDHSRSNMWHRYNDLVANAQLIPVTKWFSEISIEELTAILTRL